MNTFEAILSRMKASYSGTASTLEGTFTGDLLQAVANELARSYSQELEPVADRAFVARAEGEWLDAVCGNYGISRKEEESDEQLRSRTLAQIRRRAGGGNAAQYEEWAETVPGVFRAQAIPLVRGAGTVNVYIIPETTDAPSTLCQTVASTIEALRPIGASVQVETAMNCPITIAASVTLKDSALLSDVQTAYAAAVKNYLLDTALTEDGSRVSISRLSALLLDCAGVGDVESLTINNRDVSMIPGDGCYASAGTITLTQVSANG